MEKSFVPSTKKKTGIDKISYFICYQGDFLQGNLLAFKVGLIHLHVHGFIDR